MRLRMVCAACAVVVTPSAVRAADEPDSLRIAVMAGAGAAYDLLGAHVEVRLSHVALFVGTGVMAFVPEVYLRQYPPGLGGCGGLRYYSGRGDGIFGSLNLTYAGFDGTYDPGTRGSQPVSGSFLTGTGTLGWRGRSDHFLYEVGAGLGMYWLDRPPTGNTGNPPPGVGNTSSTGLIPDVSLAVGWEF